MKERRVRIPRPSRPERQYRERRAPLFEEVGRVPTPPPEPEPEVPYNVWYGKV